MGGAAADGRRGREPSLTQPNLSATASAALVELARLLADGFTGKIELDCAQGGVTTLRVTTTRRGSDLAKSGEGR